MKSFIVKYAKAITSAKNDLSPNYQCASSPVFQFDRSTPMRQFADGLTALQFSRSRPGIFQGSCADFE
ncbi:MAG: hypothetical protein OEM48_04060 [Gammaproteobacteria bacterium]|nr:hypothetical protein [Gammaproteobacteria bacterium]MDH3370546.1 hypothetical protein [Gammaproteobacteria bacterium]MDH3406094.1 hypothetical protein [Gammaproteobacteria bacterium]MDH3562795.1 hypothetical protein [Gammaproteobacteria bacterium]MDH5486556.1 hypothetical protein [Gammaproteobacteria bacterium]